MILLELEEHSTVSKLRRASAAGQSVSCRIIKLVANEWLVWFMQEKTAEWQERERELTARMQERLQGLEPEKQGQCNACVLKTRESRSCSAAGNMSLGK
jgi:hypothetical protein